MARRSTRLAWFAVLTASTIAAGQEPKAMPKKVMKTDAEWAKLLSPDQFLVTRRKATEPAFSGKLLHNKGKGIYACVCCNNPLFTSRTKFESGTGWPSFFAPYARTSVVNEVDRTYGETRMEVLCATCGAHLGHVFDDGPPPTGLRYCMNSLSLKFVRDVPASAKATSKGGNTTNATPDDPAGPKQEDPAKAGGDGS